MPVKSGLPKVVSAVRVTIIGGIRSFVISSVPRSAGRVASWKYYAIAGYALIFFTFGVLGVWAAVARLDKAVIAPGTITEENSRKTVEHLEGGIIHEILVKEGQRVAKGDVLLRFDQVQARATLMLVRSQLDAGLAQEARLVAEQKGSDTLQIPMELVSRRGDPGVSEIVNDQRNQLKERRASITGQIGLLDSRILQLQDEIKGIEVERTSTIAQAALVEQELVGLRLLHERNLIPLTRLLTLEREKTRLDGVIGRSVAEKAKAANAIGETGLQIAQFKQKVQEEIAGQLLDVRQKVSELREKVDVAKDVFNRLDVKAPKSGVIQSLKIYTIGQVVHAGEPLMEIVPDDDNLVVHVQFSPTELENIRAGMQAEIKFPSFHSRRIPVILGNLDTISHDRLIDESTHQPYFLGIVQIHNLDAPADIKDRLRAGMPAEVIISTGERSALSYMLEPFVEAMGHSFHER